MIVGIKALVCAISTEKLVSKLGYDVWVCLEEENGGLSCGGC